MLCLAEHLAQPLNLKCYNYFKTTKLLCLILRQILQLPSLNGHNLDPRGPIDLNSFPMARPLPGLGDGHRNCPKSLFLARVISVQSMDTKWYFWALLFWSLFWASLFWFSLFLNLPLWSNFYNYTFIGTIYFKLQTIKNDFQFQTHHFERQLAVRFSNYKKAEDCIC